MPKRKRAAQPDLALIPITHRRAPGSKSRKLLQVTRSQYFAVDSSATACNTDSTTSTPYRYTPLAEGCIRLLHLNAGELGTQLHAHLYDFPLDEAAGQYEAISYVWGPAIFPKELRIKGSGVIMITESLFAALEHIRQPNRCRTLWADAVCIDQKDPVERSVQILLMRDIYSNASRILIWLGLSRPSDLLAFATMKLQDQARLYSDKLTSNPTGCQRVLKTLERKLTVVVRQRRLEPDAIQDGSVGIQGLSAVASLLSNEYFSRLWVLQELPRGQENDALLLAGPLVATFRSFNLILAVLLALKHADLTNVPNLNSILNEHTERMSDFTEVVAGHSDHFEARTVLTQLAICRKRKCADPRDRIFALYHVLHMNQALNVLPDYNMSTLDVYRDFCVACFDHAWVRHDWGAMYMLLAFAGTESAKRSKYWPSWLPNFHQLTERSASKLNCAERSENRYTTRQRSTATVRRLDGGDAPFSLKNTRDCGALDWRGLLAGIVCNVLPNSAWPQVDFSSLHDMETELVAWYCRCRGYLKRSLNSAIEDEDLSTILTCGHVDVINRIDDNLYEVLVKMFQNTWLYGNEFWKKTFFSVLIQRGRDYAYTNRIDYGRKLAYVDVGGTIYLGWVPKGSKAGDRLVVFKDLPYPFVLRSRDDGAFTLLGDAWVRHLNLSKALGTDNGRSDDSRSEGDRGREDESEAESDSGITDESQFENNIPDAENCFDWFGLDRVAQEAIGRFDWIRLK